MTEDREAKEVEESPDTGKIAKKKLIMEWTIAKILYIVVTMNI